MDRIFKKIKDLFEELGFETVIINEQLYSQDGSYYKITYVEGLKAIVIESAANYDEAKNKVFEDSDLYPISLGEDEILIKLRNDLMKDYLSK